MKKVKLIDRRLFWIMAIIAAFIAVQIGRVAGYANQFDTAWLSWLFAIALEGLVVFSAYMTKYDITRKRALASYAFAVAASGCLNVGYIKPWNGDLVIVAWVYSLSPTVALSCCGFQLSKTVEVARRYPRKTGEARRSPAKSKTKDFASKPILRELTRNLNGGVSQLTATKAKQMLQAKGYQIGVTDRAIQMWVRELKESK